jgi:hypothetical protein
MTTGPGCYRRCGPQGESEFWHPSGRRKSAHPPYTRNTRRQNRAMKAGLVGSGMVGAYRGEVQVLRGA